MPLSNFYRKQGNATLQGRGRKTIELKRSPVISGTCNKINVD